MYALFGYLPTPVVIVFLAIIIGLAARQLYTYMLSNMKITGYANEDNTLYSIATMLLLFNIIVFIFRVSSLYYIYYYIYNVLLFLVYGVLLYGAIVLLCKHNYKSELGDNNYKNNMHRIKSNRLYCVALYLVLGLTLRMSIGFYTTSFMFRVTIIATVIICILIRIFSNKNIKLLTKSSKNKTNDKTEETSSDEEQKPSE